MKFTDRQIKALKPKKERYEVWETNGNMLIMLGLCRVPLFQNSAPQTFCDLKFY